MGFKVSAHDFLYHTITFTDAYKYRHAADNESEDAAFSNSLQVLKHAWLYGGLHIRMGVVSESDAMT